MADDLESLTAERAYVAQQAALMRLQLYTVIRTHEMFGEFASTARGILMRAAGEDGQLSGGLEIHLALEGLAKQWGVTFRAWREMVEGLRWNAAALPFGTLAVLHRHYLGRGAEERRSRGETALNEAEPSPVFKPQVDAIVRAAGERVYGDGLNWSSRVWKFEHSSLDGMKRIVYEGVAKGDSAWRIAERLEGHLGAGRGCPRWGRSRLFRLTKKDIASGDRTGLYSGDECAGQGVAYNALRLARNEIQIAHHTATDALWSQMPWIEQERIVLSPAHPKEDICDDAATGGTNGDGVYPKGTISLPLHPQCVTPGQLVATQRGAIPIEQVVLGDMALTHWGRYRRVVKVWKHSHCGPVLRILTDQGDLELTGEHPVLLRSGWVEAQFIKVGDQIFNPRLDVLSTHAAGKTKDAPTLLVEPGVSDTIMLRMALMPAIAVAFDGDKQRRDGEVYEIATDIVFPLKPDASTGEGIAHGRFERSRMGEAGLPTGLQHWHKAGIVPPFGGGDFEPDFRRSGWRDSSGEMSLAVDTLHGCRGGGPALIGIRPGRRDGLAQAAQWDTAQRQQIAQNPVCDTVALEDYRATESLDFVDVVEEIGERPARFGFETQPVKFDGADSVLGEVGRRDPAQMLPTDGTSDLHDNLLALCPDIPRGAGSGNPVVRGVASPSQALRDYSTVLAVEEVQYSGQVYNLSVLDDNSYTVGGLAVHNCLCFKVAVQPSEQEFTGRLRGWMRGEGAWQEMDAYAGFVGRMTGTPVGRSGLGSVNLLVTIARRLAVWLWGDESALDDALALLG